MARWKVVEQKVAIVMQPPQALHCMRRGLATRWMRGQEHSERNSRAPWLIQEEKDTEPRCYGLRQIRGQLPMRFHTT